MSELKQELKEKIIEQLNLQDINIADFSDDMPLFGEGLGLDSIDALELIVLLQQDYNIKISNPEQGREIFQSINSLSDFISKNS
ncbi:MAG: phosphopantetheine-binding protein [Bacteroidales bacterium]